MLAGAGNLTLVKRQQEFRNFSVHALDDLLYLFNSHENGSALELSAQYAAPESGRGLSIHKQQTFPTASTAVAPNEEHLSTRARASTDPADTHEHLRVELSIQSDGKSNQYSFTGDIWFDGPTLRTKQEAGMQEASITARFVHDRLWHDTRAVGEILVLKRKQELLRYLQVVDPKVQDISIHGSNWYLDIGTASMLPHKMFGSGIIRACTILAYCILGKSRILLVDELESGLHYKAIAPLLRGMIDCTTKSGTQVFVTTQSLDVLRGLQEVYSDEEMVDQRSSLACYALQRDRTGLVRPYRYDYEDFDYCIENQFEVR